MKELIILTIITGLVFLTFLMTIILGFTKKSKKLKLTSLFVSLTFIICVGWTSYRIVNKTYNKVANTIKITSYKIVNKTFNKVANTLKMRTGDEIYDVLFNKRKTDCVEVLNYQDQVVPKIDYAIWLHFKTCPKELERILSKHDFNNEKLPTLNGEIPPEENLEWFNPTSLGDTILVYEFSTDDGRNIQTIWANLDSTEVFLRDILD